MPRPDASLDSCIPVDKVSDTLLQLCRLEEVGFEPRENFIAYERTW